MRFLLPSNRMIQGSVPVRKQNTLAFMGGMVLRLQSDSASVHQTDSHSARGMSEAQAVAFRGLPAKTRGWG